MAQNNFNNGPGGRLKREEKKNRLVVSSPNAPELKAYQDSLAAYNYGEKTLLDRVPYEDKLYEIIRNRNEERGVFDDKWRVDSRKTFAPFRGLMPLEAEEVGTYQMSKPPYMYPEEIPENWQESRKFVRFKKPERQVVLSKQAASAPATLDMSFLKPKDTPTASAATTSIDRPIPRIVESRMYLQKNPNDLKNLVVADVANAIGLDVRNMNPEQYKRVATVIEEFNKKHGGPSVAKNKGRAFYEPFFNSINIYPKIKDPRLVQDSLYKNRPDVYFQELAHSSQFKNEPIKSALSATKGALLYEDSNVPEKGRYAIPGEFEYEAHKEIAPRLWDEFKTLYKKKYKENVPPQYENKYREEQEKLDTEKFLGGKLQYKGKMLPQIEVIQPVKRP